MVEETLRTKEVQSILKYEFENWIRWGKKNDWKPSSFKCPLGFMYKPSLGDVYEESYRPEPCDELEAVKLERIVISLPDKHKEAFVMYQLDKAAVNGFIVLVKGRDDKARALGVHKSKYHELVSEAHNMIYRSLQKNN